MKRRAGALLLLATCLALPCLAETVSYTGSLQVTENVMATGGTLVVTGPTTNSFIKARYNENLISIMLDDVELQDVIRMFTRISDANIIASPANLQGRVTVNLTDVEWRPALESILDMHCLELVERTPGSGVFSIVPRLNWDYENMGRLIFRTPGDLSPTNPVTLNLTNTTLRQVLCEIAKQAHINVCYSASRGEKGDFTIAFTNADSHDVLVQLAAMQQTELTWSPRLNSYVVGAPLAAYVPAPQTTAPTTSVDHGAKEIPVMVLIVCGIFLWALFWSLVRSDRKDSAGAAPSTRRSWFGLLFLSVLYGILIFEAIFGWMLADEKYLLKLFAGGVFLGAILFTIAMHIRKACRARGWHPRGARRVFVWCLAWLPLTVFFMDSRPLDKDYSWQDLPTPKQNAAESYALLEKIYGMNPVETGISVPDVSDPAISSNILAYAGQIEQAWADMSEMRSIVDRLAAFDEVADLRKTEFRPDDLYIGSTPQTSTFRDIGNVYAAYVTLRMQQGRAEEAATALGTYHTAVSKILTNARWLILRMICVASIDRNTSLAWSIMAKSNNDPQVAIILSRAFLPLRQRQVSMKTSLLAEYLAQKDFLNHCRGDEWLTIIHAFRGEWVSGIWLPPKPPTFFQSIASRAICLAAVRRNRTIDDLRQYRVALMDETSGVPSNLKPAGKLMDRYLARPQLTNLGGWLFVSVASPSYDRAAQKCTEVKILTDLLYMEIKQRLGEQMILNDPYTWRKPYGFDESHHTWFSIGPDKKPYTKDDIYLK